MPRPTFAQACAQFVNRYTCQHVPAWAQKINTGNGMWYAPHFATDVEWYANTKFHGEEGHVGKRTDCYTSGQTWPLGKWLDQRMPHGYKLVLDLYAVNAPDGDTLFCLEAYSLAQAQVALPDALDAKGWEVGHTYHTQRETRASYDVYSVVSQQKLVAEAFARLMEEHADKPVTVDGVVYLMDADSVYDSDGDDGVQFWFFHGLTNPTADAVAALIRQRLPSGGAK